MKMPPNTSRSERRKRALERIAYAESLGMERWAPYADPRLPRHLRSYEPRWAYQGGHYSYDQLPLSPALANDLALAQPERNQTPTP